MSQTFITTPNPPVKQGDKAVATVWRYEGTNPSMPTTTTYSLASKESFVASIGHDISMLGRFPVGGPFSLCSYTIEYGMAYLAPWYRKSVGRWYGGRFTNDPQLMNDMPSMATAKSKIDASKSEAYANGARAIALTNPVRPEVDVVTAVAETVKDGIPHIVGHTLWRDKTLTAKNAGSEYLNVEFGWKPLVNDVRKFAKTVMDSESIIQNYERGSGKRQRRSFNFPTHDLPGTTRLKTNSTPYPTDTTSWGLSTLSAVPSTSDRMWFNGAFRYYLAPSGTKRYAQLASKLYGISLTPDKLWELAPWSWALDWFGNVGDVMSNISYLGSDACVMEWGYMMHQTDLITMHTQTTPPASHPDAKVTTFASREVLSYKTRIWASPYGFSASPVALSLRQEAIVTALGLSRLRR